MLLGPLNPRWARLPDMDRREWIALAPLALLTVLFGVWPQPFLNGIRSAVTSLTRVVSAGSATAIELTSQDPRRTTHASRLSCGGRGGSRLPSLVAQRASFPSLAALGHRTAQSPEPGAKRP